MGVSKNNGTPKSSILIGVSIINHPFWGTPIFGNTVLLLVVKYRVRSLFCFEFSGGAQWVAWKKKQNACLFVVKCFRDMRAQDFAKKARKLIHSYC